MKEIFESKKIEKKMSQFVVIGLGRFGKTLATALSNLGNDVLAIDTNPEAVRTVENIVTSKTLTDGQTFKIRAVGDGRLYSTSAWSNSVTYTEGASIPQPTKLETPNVTISKEGVASWTAVANANGYMYKLDDGRVSQTTETSVQLADGQSIAVKAVGDGTNYTDSDYSEAKTYTKDTVDTPAAVVTVEEYFLNGELVSENGKNCAKFTVCAFISNDVCAQFDRVEIYDGQKLVLKDEDFEGFSEYSNLN